MWYNTAAPTQKWTLVDGDEDSYGSNPTKQFHRAKQSRRSAKLVPTRRKAIQGQRGEPHVDAHAPALRLLAAVIELTTLPARK